MKKFKRKTIATNMSSVHFCKIMAVVQTQMEPRSMVKLHQLLQFINPRMKAVEYQYINSKKEKVLSITTREERSILNR
jgi:hypothetical protein